MDKNKGIEKQDKLKREILEGDVLLWIDTYSNIFFGFPVLFLVLGEVSESSLIPFYTASPDIDTVQHKLKWGNTMKIFNVFNDFDAKSEFIHINAFEPVRTSEDSFFFYYRCRMEKYELCLEPCMNGYDVGLYELTQGGDMPYPQLITPKRCTEVDAEEEQHLNREELGYYALFRALFMANNLLQNQLYEDRRKLA